MGWPDQPEKTLAKNRCELIPGGEQVLALLVDHLLAFGDAEGAGFIEACVGVGANEMVFEGLTVFVDLDETGGDELAILAEWLWRDPVALIFNRITLFGGLFTTAAKNRLEETAERHDSPHFALSSKTSGAGQFGPMRPARLVTDRRFHGFGLLNPADHQFFRRCCPGQFFLGIHFLHFGSKVGGIAVL